MAGLKRTRVRTEGLSERGQKLLEQLLSLPGDLSELFERFEGVVNTAVQARARYKRDHWGKEGKNGLRVLRAADTSKPDVLVELGRLHSVTYETAKGEDRKPQLYEHVFDSPAPRLCYSVAQGGLLVVAGGKYTVTKRGIEG